MKIKLLLLSITLTSQLFAQSYEKIHRKAIVVDTHNDILMKAADKGIVFDQDLTGKTNSDLARWKKGGLDVQVFSVYCDGDLKNPYDYANREMDSLDAVVARNPDKIVKVAGYAELVKAVKQHKIAAMFGVEGGHMIEDDLNKLDALYKRGARYLTLTHNIAPSWATSAADETTKPALPHKGLTDFGRQVVQHMNELGMIIDVSHAGDQTFRDVIETTKKPIIASHSSVYSLVPHRRNLKDDQIKAIAKNGGVIQVNFNPGFIDSSYDKKETAFLKKHAAENDSLLKSGLTDYYAVDYLYGKYADEANTMRPPLSMVIRHIEYIIKLVGVDYVGLGSDFDGINLTPLQLDDVTTYPLITKALVEKGYSKKDITKILGGNFLRVLKANEEK
ncbi:dipeptidase [Flavihumibacter profundi]|uniref:dipeptidase n=1 Tax=Flavihumibacter profundi TaxID=2716883 RepID=UPI001CC570DA|nr:dipeptidase [Flavihumibacter profundi]MBZ5855496.1 dipeptidase [Flavihumibacter profundi]